MSFIGFHIDLCSLRFLITSETFFHTDYPGFRSDSVWRWGWAPFSDNTMLMVLSSKHFSIPEGSNVFPQTPFMCPSHLILKSWCWAFQWADFHHVKHHPLIFFIKPNTSRPQSLVMFRTCVFMAVSSKCLCKWFFSPILKTRTARLWTVSDLLASYSQ